MHQLAAKMTNPNAKMPSFYAHKHAQRAKMAAQSGERPKLMSEAY